MPSKFFDGTNTKPAIRGGWFLNDYDWRPFIQPQRRPFAFVSAWKKIGSNSPRWTQPTLWPDYSVQGIWQSRNWGNSRWKHGTNQRFRIDGITRDVYGSAMAGATVLCLGQAAGDIVYTTTSDTIGAYTVYTPYYGPANIVVSYKPGTPDIAGAVINVQGI